MYTSNNFETKFQIMAAEFLKELTPLVDNLNLELDHGSIDHLCFRVETENEYQQYKDDLQKIGSLLVESIVGARLIATYKLNSPIKYNDIEVDVIELPQPKPNSKYKTAFEHVEYVIKERFDKIIENHPEIKFDLGAMQKKINPDIRVKFSNDLSIKLHHQSLEAVIKYEKTMI